MSTVREALRRFMDDKYSYNDYLTVSSYFKNQEEVEWKSYLEEEWNDLAVSENDDQEFDSVLKEIHRKIEYKEDNKETYSTTYYHLFSRVAAILILPALITISVLSYFVFEKNYGDSSFAEIHAPKGTRVKFQLPDGSEGWLNSGSSIKYPVSFNDRKVEVSGEAWFDVVHKQSKVFRVITPYFDVKVMGTKFNVVSYDNEKTAQVILEQGKVSVLDKNSELKTELEPDQQVVFDKTKNKLTKSSIDSKVYTSWKDGTLVFRNAPMSEIAKRLERNFNAEIILHGEKLKASVFRLTFRDESLEEIFKELVDVAPIRYQIHRPEVQDDGFSKSKIEVWLR
jgi:ferric-dicitrate binding protein FerR (iron transport regulator)